jgi:hypothetical protein
MRPDGFESASDANEPSGTAVVRIPSFAFSRAERTVSWARTHTAADQRGAVSTSVWSVHFHSRVPNWTTRAHSGVSGT